MHASHAYVNGAGGSDEDLRLLNALLTGASSEQPRPADQGKSVDRGKSRDERQAEEENKADTATRPGGFKNDPDDPKNPNEVRERHLNQIKR